MEDALKTALQTQTDTLVAIAMIIVALALFYMVRSVAATRKNQITLPATEPGGEAKVISRDDLIVQMFSDYRDQLRIANEFKADSMKLNQDLAKRLEVSDATNERLASTLNDLNKRIDEGAIQAITIRNEAVKEVVKFVESKLSDMGNVRSELVTGIKTVEERVEKMVEEVKGSNGQLVAKMGEVAKTLERLANVIADLTDANKQMTERVANALNDVQEELVEILETIVADKETKNESVSVQPGDQDQLVSPVAGKPADSGTPQGAPALPANHGPADGSSLLQNPPVAPSGPASVASDPDSSVHHSSPPGPVLRPPEGSAPGGSPEPGREPTSH